MYNIVLSLLIIINSFYASGSIENKLDHTLPIISSKKEYFDPSSLIQPLPNKTESETLEYMIAQIGNNKWPVLVFDCYDLKKMARKKYILNKMLSLKKFVMDFRGSHNKSVKDIRTIILHKFL